MTDFLLTDDGDVAEGYRPITDRLTLISQRVRIRLLTALGEWFRDTRVGIPVFDWLAQKPVRPAEIGARLVSEVRAVPGVVTVADVVSVYDRAARTYTFSGDVLTDAGTLKVVFAPLDTGPGNQVIDLILLPFVGV